MLCCIFNYPPHYREAIYRLMDEELHPHFYFGDRVAGGQIQEMDCTKLEGYRGRFRCVTYKRKILWMSKILGLLFRREYTCYILSNDSACLSEWLFLYLARLMGKPTYLWTHGWYGNESRWARFRNLAFYRPVSGLLLYGNRARRLLMEQGVAESKLHVIANSLDYDHQLALRGAISSTNVYHSLFGNDRPTLLFIGRLTAVKKLDMLLRSVGRLRDLGHNINVAIVGSGPEEARLEQQVAELGLAACVRLLGACYDERLNAQYIHDADLCVSPGNVGLTAIHSLTYGTPVVTHNNFSLQMPEFEAISDGQTGAFFMEGSVESLTNTIAEWLTKHPRKDRATIEACYKTIDDVYNPHRQLAVLRQVLSKQEL